MINDNNILNSLLTQYIFTHDFTILDFIHKALSLMLFCFLYILFSTISIGNDSDVYIFIYILSIFYNQYNG